MSKKRLQEKVQELVELREMADELADEIAAIEDEIKAHMNRTGTDTLEAGKHVVRWAVVKSSRFDSKAFRSAFPTIYADYSKPTETRRFTLTRASMTQVKEAGI